MIQTQNVYYLDLGKTGSSFVEHVIHEACGIAVKSKKGVRHKGFDSLPTDKFFEENLVFTTMRNPFTYYVSHLTFSRKTNGPIWKGLKAQGYDDKQYPNSVEGYVESMMVKRMHLPENNHNNPEKKAWMNMPDDLGMLTMQYILLLDKNFLLQKKRTVQEIEDWYDKYWFNEQMDNLRAIGKSNLNLEIARLIRDKSEFFPKKPNFDKVLNQIENTTKARGQHKNQGLNYKQWHTDKSKEIVQHYDRILIKHMGYDYESI